MCDDQNVFCKICSSSGQVIMNDNTVFYHGYKYNIKMGQVALKSSKLYRELVIMNKIYFGESYSLPSLFTIITSLAFSLVVHMR